MKIALPIALVAFGIVLVVTLMWRMPAQPRTDADVQADRDKVDAAQQQWLSQHPTMKAEDAALAQVYEQAETAKRRADEVDESAHQDLETHNQKLKEEVVKADPSSEAAYGRLSYDRRMGGIRSGNEELAAQVDDYGWRYRVTHYVTFPFLSIDIASEICLGIYLLFRRPTMAGAHVFLLLVLLPTTYAAPLLWQIVCREYLERFSGIGEWPGFAELLTRDYDLLAKIYLWSLPGLFLYFLLLFRIQYRK